MIASLQLKWMGGHSLGESIQWTRIAWKRSQNSLYSQNVRFGITIEKKTTTTNHQLMALFALPRYPVIGTMLFKWFPLSKSQMCFPINVGGEEWFVRFTSHTHTHTTNWFPLSTNITTNDFISFNVIMRLSVSFNIENRLLWNCKMHYLNSLFSLVFTSKIQINFHCVVVFFFIRLVQFSLKKRQTCIGIEDLLPKP